MYHLDEHAICSNNGRTGIACPFCKTWVFNPTATTEDNEARLAWRCVQCNAIFTSKPPFHEPGDDKESFKEKIILLLLEEGNCERVVKLFATSSKRPPIFVETQLRSLLKNV